MAETEMRQQLPPCIEENEINLLDYWRVIWKRRKFIGYVVAVTVVLTIVASLLMTNIYQAKAVITPVSAKESGGGAGTLSLLAQQLGGLPGIALPGGSSASEIVNLLKSNILREKIIDRHQLLPVLFHKQWDAEKKEWKRGGWINLNPKKDPAIPDVWDGLRKFDDIVKVYQNAKENTITVAVDYRDPGMAAKIVEYFLTTLTDHMSSEARRVATINRKYLEEQLNNTADPLIKQKIYNLIAQQLETTMMAEVKENFAFKLIDPPKVPDKKIKPKRTQMVLLSLVAALFVGIFAAFFMEYIEKVKNKERENLTT